MKIERRLGTRLIVNLVLLAYWFPALIADTVIQCQKVDGVYIFTDYSTNWCSVLILVHLITAIVITAMDLKYNGATETLILIRNRVTHMTIIGSISVTLNWFTFSVSKWTLQSTHEHLVNTIVMSISVLSLNSHFRKRDFWLGES